MTNTRPKVEPDGLYNVKQTAAALEVDRHTIQRYTIMGVLKCRIRQAGRHKLYSGRQIIRCWEKMYL